MCFKLRHDTLQLRQDVTQIATGTILCFDEDMNQSESFVGVFRSWYDCQSNTYSKFLNYSGNV